MDTVNNVYFLHIVLVGLYETMWRRQGHEKACLLPKVWLITEVKKPLVSHVTDAEEKDTKWRTAKKKCVAIIAREATTQSPFADERDKTKPEKCLVDSGAMLHIKTFKKKFISLGNSFKPGNHLVKVADGTKCSTMAYHRAMTLIYLQDK